MNNLPADLGHSYIAFVVGHMIWSFSIYKKKLII